MNIFFRIKRKYNYLVGKHYIKRKCNAPGNILAVTLPIKIENGQYITVGKNLAIGEGCEILCFDKYIDNKFFPNLKIGDNCSITGKLKILCAGNITIGNNVTFASDVFISDENHGTNPDGNYLDNKLEVKDVSIGDGSWIGEKVCILPGASVGKKCIVGAGAVVTKKFPDYCMIAGNPAKVIKEFSRETKKWEKV